MAKGSLPRGWRGVKTLPAELADFSIPGSGAAREAGGEGGRDSLREDGWNASATYHGFELRDPALRPVRYS